MPCPSYSPHSPSLPIHKRTQARATTTPCMNLPYTYIAHLPNPKRITPNLRFESRNTYLFWPPCAGASQYLMPPPTTWRSTQLQPPGHFLTSGCLQAVAAALQEPHPLPAGSQCWAAAAACVGLQHGEHGFVNFDHRLMPNLRSSSHVHIGIISFKLFPAKLNCAHNHNLL